MNAISPDFLSVLQYEANRLSAIAKTGLESQSNAEKQEVIKGLDALISTLGQARLSVKNSLDSTSVITEESIQETFYNAIPEALDSNKGLINANDIEAEEPFVFLAFGALATLKVLEASSDLPIGLRLLGGKIVTKSNCPESHARFLDALLLIKKEISKLDEDNIKLLKTFCVNNPNLALPDKIPAPIKQLGTHINHIASEITQRPGFKRFVKDVLEVSAAFCEK